VRLALEGHGRVVTAVDAAVEVGLGAGACMPVSPPANANEADGGDDEEKSYSADGDTDNHRRCQARLCVTVIIKRLRVDNADLRDRKDGVVQAKNGAWSGLLLTAGLQGHKV
jgi:hypothetical protein